ncbi:DUF1109 domain-containing protein [Blastomonas sp. AAP53]|uniref:NrsF family protein n=1 Tax=Blastomonas sp. AAP53 TaxID=1248760 RepID=UPI000303DB0C|nr:DUF1109 domain-containing protein [Blastomonas sp. AAP53]
MDTKPPATAQPGEDDRFIDTLIGDLQPIRRLKPGQGLALALLVAVACGVAISAWLGIRGDLANGAPHAMFVLRSAVLLALGIGAATAVLAAASPGIGVRRPGWWRWALGVAMLFPAGALLTWLVTIDTAAQAISILDPRYGLECLRMSALCALAVGGAMVLWLRRGAAVDPVSAGWLVGLAAGSLGAAAYSVACSENVVLYIGTWYTIALAGCTIAGRLIVPALLRW